MPRNPRGKLGAEASERRRKVAMEGRRGTDPTKKVTDRATTSPATRARAASCASDARKVRCTIASRPPRRPASAKDRYFRGEAHRGSGAANGGETAGKHRERAHKPAHDGTPAADASGAPRGRSE